MDWTREFAVAVGDARLTRRAQLLGQRLMEQMQTSLRDACHGWAEVIGAARFFRHARVTLDAVLAPHQACTLERAQAYEVVYAIQDTTDVVASARKVRGVGPLNGPEHTGLLWHQTWVVAPDGVPLGIWRVETLVREDTEPRTSGARHATPLAEKESVRWLTGYQEAGALQEAAGVPVVSVADREADLYEIFAEVQTAAAGATAAADWVIRGRHDRTVVLQDGTRPRPLRLALALAPCWGAGQVAVPARAGQPARVAAVQIKVLTVTLRPPWRPGGVKLAPVAVTVVWVHEIDPPADGLPLDWQLLTSLPVATLAAAARVIAIYARRWDIEVFFGTWKMGCTVERLQLTTRERLEPCLGLYAIVAWRVLWLSRLSRACPTWEATDFFSTDEWQVIRVRARQRGEPLADGTLRSVVRAVASIGGFFARPAAEEPGVDTLWKGLMRVADGVQLLQGLRQEHVDTEMCI